MKKEKLGKTNLHVSTFILGTGAYGTQIDELTSYRLLDQYRDYGGDTLDTANYYGRIHSARQLPMSEMLLGNWIHDRKNRNELVLCTKGGCYEVNHPGRQRLRLEDISNDIHDSLKNLKTDYLDFYWLHQDDIMQPVEGIIELLNRFVREGKIRYFGCSNWELSRILKAQKYARDQHLQGFEASQRMFNLAKPNKEALDKLRQTCVDDIMYEFHCESKMPLAAYSSQALGFFSVGLKEDYHVNPKYKNCIRYFENDENMRRLMRTEQLSRQKGMTPIQINLAFLRSQPFQILPIIGPMTIEELRESIGAVEKVLTKEECRFLIE